MRSPPLCASALLRHELLQHGYLGVFFVCQLGAAGVDILLCGIAALLDHFVEHGEGTGVVNLYPLVDFDAFEFGLDERVEVDDTRALAVLDKMVKQRRDSAQQYLDAGRDELAAVENAEIAVIQEILPPQQSEDELAQMVDAAIAETGASGMQGMGPVMGKLKPQLAGRADMGAVSQLVKAKLTA